MPTELVKLKLNRTSKRLEVKSKLVKKAATVKSRRKFGSVVNPGSTGFADINQNVAGLLTNIARTGKYTQLNNQSYAYGYVFGLQPLERANLGAVCQRQFPAPPQ